MPESILLAVASASASIVLRRCWPAAVMESKRRFRRRSCGQAGPSLTGPVLENMRCTVSTARRAGSRCLLGAFRRDLFLQWQWANYRLQLALLPLSGGGGGGARAADRKRNEKIATLANAVGELASRACCSSRLAGLTILGALPLCHVRKKRRKGSKCFPCCRSCLMPSARLW